MEINPATMDYFQWITMLAKIGVVVFAFLNIVPIMVWVERRGSALMQNRLGPNRVGPLGLLQSLADVVKFIFKEDLIPDHVEKFYYLLAPAVSVIVAFMTFAVVPFAGALSIGDRIVQLQMAELNVGLLYVFSIASLGVYGIILAGWSSRNKYSVLGGLRSSAQMISYELSMGLSILGILMVFETFSLREIVQGQSVSLLGPIPKWGFFIQPLGFLIFLTAIYAETNRLPFDLPEGESEIVAGFHLEYGSMKFALFFMAEYMNMLTGSALVATLFFGGFDVWPLGFMIEPLANNIVNPLLSAVGGNIQALLDPTNVATVMLQVMSFVGKVGFFMWLFVWVRWTLPRFRYDQLMNFGWKAMLPLSLANVVVTAVMIYFGWI
jgi:NADH-quinone oxidoreductase subunit H